MCGSGAFVATPEGFLCALHSLEVIDTVQDWVPLLRTTDGRDDRLEGEKPVD
jgi:hypothetical protein